MFAKREMLCDRKHHVAHTGYVEEIHKRSKSLWFISKTSNWG